MNTSSTARTSVRFAALIALALLVAPAYAHRCDAPAPGGEARACAAAAQGADALRRFIERTRMIYGLYYFDVYRGDEDAARPPESGSNAPK
jgi:hypothetical protein